MLKGGNLLNLIKWLEDWYLSQCDGDWEHSYGLKISNIDNPWWHMSNNLLDTPLENK